MKDAAIAVSNLVFDYGRLRVIEGLSLEVPPVSASACSGPTAPARPR